MDSARNAEPSQKRPHRIPDRKARSRNVIKSYARGLGLAGSIAYLGRRFPDWLVWELWIFYALAVYGSLKAWWIPYLLILDERLATRYRAMYANTHAFLPERNGITPNTLHVVFDSVTIAILVVLAMLTFRGDFGT